MAKNKKLLLSLIVFLFISTKLYSKEPTVKLNNKIEILSARTVTLLPITSNLDDDDKEEVFESLQKYIKFHGYLKYQHNEDFYNILKRKKEKVKDYLSNKEIMKVVSKQFSAGSIIRVDIQQHSYGSVLKLDILNQNGDSQYYKRETFINKEVSYLRKILDHWLSGFFGKSIDQANIISIQKNEIIIEYPKSYDNLYPKKQFIIIKNSSIVGTIAGHENYIEEDQEKIDKTVVVAHGFISHLDNNFITGSISKTHPGQKISLNDQVIFKDYNLQLARKNPHYQYYKYDLSNYRDKGQFSLYKVSDQLVADGLTASYSGIQLNADIYLPSKKIISFEYSGHTSQISSEDSITPNEIPLSNNYKILFGRTVIPKNIKYIRYIDLMGGLFIDNYSLSALGISNVEDQNFMGPTITLKMEHPISRGFTLMTGMDFNMTFNLGEVAERILIDSENPMGYNMELGLRYRFKDLPWSIKGLYQIKNNKIKIEDGDSSEFLNIQSNNILIGISNYF